MGFKDYLFAGVDSLNATIDQALSEDKREMSPQVLNPGSNRSSELNETLGPKSCTAFS